MYGLPWCYSKVKVIGQSSRSRDDEKCTFLAIEGRYELTMAYILNSWRIVSNMHATLAQFNWLSLVGTTSSEGVLVTVIWTLSVVHKNSDRSTVSSSKMNNELFTSVFRTRYGAYCILPERVLGITIRRGSIRRVHWERKWVDYGKVMAEEDEWRRLG